MWIVLIGARAEAVVVWLLLIGRNKIAFDTTGDRWDNGDSETGEVSDSLLLLDGQKEEEERLWWYGNGGEGTLFVGSLGDGGHDTLERFMLEVENRMVGGEWPFDTGCWDGNIMDWCFWYFDGDGPTSTGYFCCEWITAVPVRSDPRCWEDTDDTYLLLSVLLKQGEVGLAMMVSEQGIGLLFTMAVLDLHDSGIETVVLREVFRDNDAEEVPQDWLDW